MLNTSSSDAPIVGRFVVPMYVILGQVGSGSRRLVTVRIIMLS